MARYSLGVPDAIDTSFDSVPQLRPPKLTARISVPRPVQAVPNVALGVQSPLQAAPGPVAPTLPRQPIAQPPPAQPPPAPVQPAPPPTDPSLNFEGSTFQTQTPQTTTTYAPNEYRIDELLAQVKEFAGLEITPQWRELAKTNPDELIRQVQGAVDYLKKYGNGTNNPDTSFRSRVDGWFSNFQAAVKQSSTAANPDFERDKLRQQAFNQAQERLTQQLGYGAREDEEQLLAILAERGLLNSGIASRELARFQSERTQNYNTQLSKLNEMLTLGQLDFLDEKTLTLLRSALQLGNETALAKLRAQLDKDAQPSALAQILGVVGGALPFALSGKKPQATLGTGDLGGYEQVEPDIYRNT